MNIIDPMGNCFKHGAFYLKEGCLGCLCENGISITGAGDFSGDSIPTKIPEPEAKISKVVDKKISKKKLMEQAEEAHARLMVPIKVPESEPESEPELETTIAITLRPGEDLEVHGHFEEAVKILDYAKARTIATVEDVKAANDDLSIIAKLKKAMEAKRREYLAPLKAQQDAIGETYNYLMSPIREADTINRDKIIAYSKEQARIRQEQEEINRKRQEAAEAEMKLKGELSESVDLVEVTPETPKHVSTDVGTTGMVDHWKWEVTDFAILPDEYKVVDGSLLTAIAKKHHDQKQVSGVRFYNEPIIAVRPK